MECTWTTLKSFISTYSLPLQWIDSGNVYYIKAQSGSIEAECYIKKDNNSDQTDFETNYKNNTNLSQKYIQIDSDGAGFSRMKQAPTGWTFQLRGLEFVTSTANSLVNNDASNNLLTDATLSFYDASNNLLTDSASITTNTVKTQLDLEPPYDYYIIGGEARIKTQPTNDVRVAVIAVPDVPASQGGSKSMVQNVNFKFISALGTGIQADGRASKLLSYNATYHTNKLRFIIYHNAGDVNNIAIFIESYLSQ